MTRPVPDPFADAASLVAAYAAVDWAATALGAVETWSPTLLASVDLMLQTRFPVTLLWGPELVLLYNEAYVQLIMDKHPAALGRRCVDVFPEAWDAIGPMLHGVLDGGPATWSEDQLLPLDRSGYLEEAYFTFSYSAVHGPHGDVEGLIDITVETTAQIVTARRLAALAGLNQSLASTQRLADLEDVLTMAMQAMPSDVVHAELRGPDAVGEAASALPERPTVRLSDHLEVEQTEAGPVVWVPVRGASTPGHDRVLGLLLGAMTALDDDYLDFVRLVGYALSQHLVRLVGREAERTLSTALQESLLSRPQHSPLVEIAVRYRPAAQAAQVGGDWYDAFQLADGGTMVVVGDVTGHDHGAAAAMGQLRNLLRGIAHLERTTPAAVLSTLELAMRGLGVDTTATAVVGELRAAVDGAARLVWSSAGHLPPVLVDPTGSASLLSTTPNLLIGVEVGAARDDHCITLEPGSTLVLYSDGLVERRREDLDLSLARLVAGADGGHALSPDELCDHLIAHVDEAGVASEDDVALMVVRLPPRPRAEAAHSRR